MKTFIATIASLAVLASLASANGVLSTWNTKGCTGAGLVWNEVPPKGCDGGCVKLSGEHSAHGNSADPDYAFTVYTDASCSKGKTVVKTGKCKNDPWKSFSYDCCRGCN